ncbi:MlaD family protein [Silicimonas algicola]|uniref:Paraquat-inducible protein B n=1 Tax=Silicimonas algicola TaxID=1826607 RepID=A0A316G977_9RHOB|nr:MlaD family protein [Silicimonas algicola]PWK57428.1 paraquat-inducible protein B [Silicimonas algicola]
MTDGAPDLPASGRRRPILERISIVWLVPLAAVAVSLWVAWQSYATRGPVIHILFEQATGITEGETELRYRDVTVGRVEDVGFSGTLERVRVSVRLDQSIAPFVDGDAIFWIIQPEVTAQGVSGLSTVLSGVYIEASWDTEADGLVFEHQGLSRPPLFRAGQEGLTIEISAGADVQLVEGTPILHKGVEVGRIGEPELAADGTVARAEAVILSPYDRLVSSNTRFWDISGFSFSLGATGAELDFSSLATLISGGVAFDTVVSGGTPVSDGADFTLFADEAAARASLFQNDSGPVLTLTAIFDENFSGLTVGAPVLLDGVNIGEVVNLNGIVDEDRFGDTNVRLSTSMELRTSKMGLAEATSEAALAFLRERVAEGLRARLVSASILTGGLRVDLVDVPDVPPATLNVEAEPFPVIPVAESDISDVSATAEGVMERINNLPIEELLEAATAFLTSATEIAESEDLKAIPGDVRGLVADVRSVTSGDEIQALPAQASALLADLQAVAENLRSIAESIEDAGTVERVTAAVDAAAEAAADVGDSVEGVPELVARLTAVAEKAEQLELQQLVDEVSGTVASARAILDDDSTRALPERLGASLAELEAALEELRTGGAVSNLNETLESASSASKAVEEAAAELPGIVERINQLAAQASATLAGFDEDSELNRSARTALGDLQDAARAVERLARTLERNPNSIILGR